MAAHVKRKGLPEIAGLLPGAEQRLWVFNYRLWLGSSTLLPSRSARLRRAVMTAVATAMSHVEPVLAISMPQKRGDALNVAQRDTELNVALDLSRGIFSCQQ
jgi:hypothetical protein